MVDKAQHPLMARWRWIASLAVIGAAVALGYTIWIPAKHRVRAQVMMLPHANDLLANSPILSGNTATPLTVLQGMFDSDAMVREMSEQFKIPASTIRSIWFVRSDQATNQLEVIADATSPDLARQMVDFSISRARDFELRANESAAGRREKQLSQSLKVQGKRNLQIENALVKTMESPDLTVWDAQGMLNMVASAETSQVQLGLLKAQRTQLATRMRRNLADPALPKDPRLDGLRQQVTKLVEQVRGAEQELGPDAPALANLRVQLSVAQDQYNRELRRAQLAVNGDLQVDIADLDAQIAGLQFQVNQQNRSVAQSPGAQSVLQTKIKQLQDTYATTADLRAKYEQARIDAEVERVNWAVITPSFLEERPINKRWARNPFAGAVLGMLFGVILAFSVPSRRESYKEVHQWPTAA